MQKGDVQIYDTPGGRRWKRALLAIILLSLASAAGVYFLASLV